VKLARFLGAAAVVLGAATSAQAATLNLTLAVDNAYSVYLSTSDAVLGSLIGSGSDWKSPDGFFTPLSANTTYFIHVIGTNVGTPGDGNPDAFIGSFNIIGGGYTFSNGGTSLLTDTSHWRAIEASDNTTWTTPISAPQSFAANGGGIWNSARPGPEPGIDALAQWIWSNPDNGQFADFSTTITATTPLPAALPLFGTGLAVIGLLVRRRRKRVVSA
jgi:hypothetical protein